MQKTLKLGLVMIKTEMFCFGTDTILADKSADITASYSAGYMLLFSKQTSDFTLSLSLWRDNNNSPETPPAHQQTVPPHPAETEELKQPVLCHRIYYCSVTRISIGEQNQPSLTRNAVVIS